MSTGVFTVELLVNLFANSTDGFKPFYSRLSNWFDTFIVAASLAHVIMSSLGVVFPNAKLFRLLRIARIVRLFASLRDLQRILKACSSAVLPVCNVFLILLVITAVYSIFGVSLFAARSPQYFRDFQTSLFTMFQVLSGDGWASDVARQLFDQGKTDPAISFFFVSYILGCSVMMLNVVVAVLLDEFIASVTREKVLCSVVFVMIFMTCVCVCVCVCLCVCVCVCVFCCDRDDIHDSVCGARD
jgi:voltage-gated sodium channel